MNFLNFFSIFFYFPFKERSCIYRERYRRGNMHFDIHFWQIRSVHCPSNDGKEAACYEGINGWKGVQFATESAFQPLMLYFVRVLFPISTLTWRANNYVSRQRNGIKRKKESTKNTFVIVYTEINFSFLFVFP